jgi:hypothetical protein
VLGHNVQMEVQPRGVRVGGWLTRA